MKFLSYLKNTKSESFKERRQIITVLIARCRTSVPWLSIHHLHGGEIESSFRGGEACSFLHVYPHSLCMKLGASVEARILDSFCNFYANAEISSAWLTCIVSGPLIGDIDCCTLGFFLSICLPQLLMKTEK